MKNVFKLSLLALALTLSLSSCNFFGDTPKAPTVDSNLTDSAKIDTSAHISAQNDTIKGKTDSIPAKH